MDNLLVQRSNADKVESVSAKSVSIKELGMLRNPLVGQILTLTEKTPMYPREIAKSLKVPEQNIYYHITKLEKAKLIEVKKTKSIHGTIAKYYAPVSGAFVHVVGSFTESYGVKSQSDFLEPFIVDGKLDATIVVGSPDPHGPQKARSRDGYYGMDLMLFLGLYLQNHTAGAVKLDTEFHENDIPNSNLIIIGGPIVNKIALRINEHSPIYISDKSVMSKLSKRSYASDETGIIAKFPNPLNPDKMILYITGLRNPGTKSAIMAFVKQFSEIEKPNQFSKKHFAHVVEGIDLDSDGVIDDVEFLE